MPWTFVNFYLMEGYAANLLDRRNEAVMIDAILLATLPLPPGSPEFAKDEPTIPSFSRIVLCFIDCPSIAGRRPDFTN